MIHELRTITGIGKATKDGRMLIPEVTKFDKNSNVLSIKDGIEYSTNLKVISIVTER